MSRRLTGQRLCGRGAALTVASALTAAALAGCAAPSSVSAHPEAAGVDVLVRQDVSAGGTARQLAALAQQDVDAGAPGVVVRVDDGSGKPVEIARQAAWTTADHRLRATDEFRMASNTKTMVGVLVLQQVAEHRLSLEDSVEKWLPGVVPGGQHITLRMLLNHTSGLDDYINDPGVLKLVTGQDRTGRP